MMRSLTRPRLLIAAVYGSLLTALPAVASDIRNVMPEHVPEGASQSAPVLPADAHIPDDVRKFCASFADAARDRRYELKRIELEKLEADVAARVAALEEKRAELEAWFKKREDFASKAEASLVGIYKNMRPDAAAARMEELGPDLVAALLLKLPERTAGVILNEMDVQKAALVTNVMVAAAGQEESQ